MLQLLRIHQRCIIQRVAVARGTAVVVAFWRGGRDYVFAPALLLQLPMRVGGPLPHHSDLHLESTMLLDVIDDARRIQDKLTLSFIVDRFQDSRQNDACMHADSSTPARHSNVAAVFSDHDDLIVDGSMQSVFTRHL